MIKTPLFEIIAGSYEEFLLGYHFSSEEQTLQQSFAAHDHTASIRCVAASDQYLASGGADDRIFIYDLKTRKEHCSLNHHNATVNCLQFTENNSHIISGSQDGVLTIVRIGNWQVEKIWEKAHKGAAILDVAIHSSGKLALTLGADKTLATWNLIKGRQAYVINLNSKSKDAKSLEKISWAPDGIHFLLIGGKYTELWSIELGGVVKHLEHNEKVTCVTWLNDNEFLTGYETGEMALVDIKKFNKKLYKGHNLRIKSLHRYEDYIISISSNGEIKVWNKNLKELAKCETGCRLTCLTVAKVKVKKEKNVEEIVIHDNSVVEEEEEEVEVEEAAEEHKEDLAKDKKKRKKKQERKEVKVENKRKKKQEEGKKKKKKQNFE